MEYTEICNICPRNCNINRSINKGYCNTSLDVKVAKAFLHKWEEPFISGKNGSGTVFFTGCNLKCVFCQNYKISQLNYGKTLNTKELASLFISLQNKGAHNINLVSPTIYIHQIKTAILLAREKGLSIPIIYNTNAYENVKSLQALDGLINIYLPDLKYYSNILSKKFSKANDYFKHATQAILEMYRQVGVPHFNHDGILENGLVIRHLILPGCIEDTKKILLWIKNNLPKEIYISLMGQYTPFYKAKNYPELNRTITQQEYEEAINYFFEIGLENGFVQETTSASEKYIPEFDLEGLE